tara:strand:- start:30131 stop:31861 length:1731 start_codon:yes stop_codon:yes gene_type:complete
MFKQFLKALKILSDGDRINFYIINLFLILSVALEFLTFTLIVPIISIIFGKNDHNQNSLLDNFKFLDQENLNMILILFLIIIVLKLSTLYFFEKKIHKTLYKIQINLNKNIYLDLLHQSWDQITRKSISEINRITGGADVMTYVTQGIYNYMIIIKNLSIMIVLGIFLLTLNPQSTLIISIIFFSFTFIFTKMHSKAATNASIKVKELRDYKYKNQYETTNGLREIKLFGFIDKIIYYYFGNELQIAAIQVKRKLVDILPKIYLEFTFICLLLVFIFIFQTNGNLINMVPTISIFVLVFARMLPLIIVINTLFQRIKFSNFSINETISLIQNAKIFETKKSDFKKSDIKAKIKIDVNSELIFENLSFKYSERNIFQNLYTKFKTNSIIGITGKNGSGKSTFLDLLSGLIKPNEGNIKINDIQLNKINSNWHELIGYLSQSYFIFDDTLIKNIIFYDDKEKIDKKLLDNVLEISGVNSFINDLPNGLESNLGSMVKFLSGGQRQKIAIARVMYRNPSILIFDEPTSSLDQQSEDEFIQTIKKLKSENKFIFIISHSKKIISNCDEVYRVENKSLFKN